MVVVFFGSILSRYKSVLGEFLVEALWCRPVNEKVQRLRRRDEP